LDDHRDHQGRDQDHQVHHRGHQVHQDHDHHRGHQDHQNRDDHQGHQDHDHQGHQDHDHQGHQDHDHRGHQDHDRRGHQDHPGACRVVHLGRQVEDRDARQDHLGEQSQGAAEYAVHRGSSGAGAEEEWQDDRADREPRGLQANRDAVAWWAAFPEATGDLVQRGVQRHVAACPEWGDHLR
jgi:hypothetical protein